MTLRLFVAIELPAPVRTVLAQMQTELRRVRGAEVKWVDPDSMHLTLQFLGAVAPEGVPAIEAALQRAAGATHAHVLRVEAAGAFPNARRARVLWAGVGGETSTLQSLVTELGSQLAPLGYPPESRPFSPHLTLGRARDPRGVSGFEAGLEGCSASREVEWRVDHVCLFQSHLSAEGPRYEAMARAELGVVHLGSE